MKKALFFFAGLVAVSLAFVGCNKEADMHVTGKKTAELRLSTVDTRTVNDGMNTEWANGDTLTVFYAPTGTTTWSQNTRFTVSDPDLGTYTVPGSVYDTPELIATLETDDPS